MRRGVYIPKIRSEANTGPKGVIADAQAFEAARRAALLSAPAKTGTAAANQSNHITPAVKLTSFNADSAEEDEDNLLDEDFKEKWQQKRREEYAAGLRLAGNKSRGRKWGTLEDVDSVEFLNVCDHSGSNTVVVVYIYDDSVSFLPGRRLCPRPPLTPFLSLHSQRSATSSSVSSASSHVNI
jgi:hypothetical protein